MNWEEHLDIWVKVHHPKPMDKIKIVRNPALGRGEFADNFTSLHYQSSVLTGIFRLTRCCGRHDVLLGKSAIPYISLKNNTSLTYYYPAWCLEIVK